MNNKRYLLIICLISLLKTCVKSESTLDTDEPGMYGIEALSGQIYIGIGTFKGNFDSVKVTLELIETDSSPYFIDMNKTRQNCEPSIKYEKILEMYEFTTINLQNRIFYGVEGLALDNACPLSKYNMSGEIFIQGVSVDSSSFILETKYGNVKCENTYLELLDLNTTRISWPLANVNVDFYSVNITQGNISLILSDEIFNNTENYVDLINLEFDTQYTLEIVSIFENQTSKSCYVELQTGKPCPTLDTEYASLIFSKAPYPDDVEILLNTEPFKSSERIISYSLYVGREIDCRQISDDKINSSGCFRAAVFYTLMPDDDFYAVVSFRLATNNTCSSKDYICNTEFEYDTDFYISIHGYSICGTVVSDSLIINIPRPFPIDIALLVCISVTISIVIILIIVLLVLTYLHMKNKYIEEEQKSLTKELIEQENEIINDDLESFSRV